MAAAASFQTLTPQCAGQGVSRSASGKRPGMIPVRKEIPTCIGLSLARSSRVQVRRKPVSRNSRCAALPVSAAIDPHAASELASQLHAAVPHLDATDVQQLSDMLYTLADADAAGEVAKSSGGWLAPVTNSLEALLKVIDGGLEAAGVPYSYGFSIIALTFIVKLVTFPLTKTQVEGTMKMQSLQPQIKALQAQYGEDQQALQAATAKLYQDSGVNPLAGCLPTLATLPVFIGLYRALTNVANEGLLTDGFFWIPSLAGPTTLAARTEGTGFSWLAIVDGAPSIGWHDALAYLVMPVVLVFSQYASQALMQPPNQDKAAAQANGVLKFLPLMIGWFSLNVPSGLTLYWLTNNILSTAQQLYLRRDAPAMATPGAEGMNMPPPSAPVNPYSPPPMPNRNMDAMEDAQFDGPVETRAERRARERASKRGSKFAARKAKEASKKKGGASPSDLPAPPVIEPEIVDDQVPRA